LRQELLELQEQVQQLEGENKKYLDMIIRHSKGNGIQMQEITQNQNRSSMDSNATKNFTFSPPKNRVGNCFFDF
jgi:hypothetical protein